VKCIERTVAPVRLQDDFAIKRFIRFILLFEEIERGRVEKRRPELVKQNPNEERKDAENEAILVNDVVKRAQA